MPGKEQILKALRQVNDPEIGKDIVSLNMVDSIQVDGGAVKVKVMLTTPACPLKDAISSSVKKAVMEVPGVETVHVDMDANVSSSREQKPDERLPQVRNIIAVGSGKGGVGKSTVAVNLAMALSQAGASVGLLDVDLYGPSVPVLMGIKDAHPSAVSVDGVEKMAPVEQNGIKIFSMGFLMQENDAVVWRGPLLHKAVQQFLEDVHWGALDYLVVDLPPGTGDIQISLSQLVPISSAVVVTTPQDLAYADVRRAVKMFEVTKVPILGIIENMAGFACPKCGTVTDVFGKGLIKKHTEELGLDYLGALPLDPAIAPGGDKGVPILIEAPDSASAEALRKLASVVAGKQSVVAHTGSAPDVH
ncbi:MAG: Mrp/NBP35 family ATP-binding protein [Deltaproteobacteria bacterium]|nr:Mrp/NBP35 family ATP-binding protein [Deltaproteobacteria bacterium]